MKTFFKTLLWTVVGLIIAVAITVTILVHGVFTAKRLTPLVNEIADSVLVVPHTLDRVELTFWSTFPHFGLEIENLNVTNPMQGAVSDTVLSVPSLVVTLNLMEFVQHKTIAINQVLLSDAAINLFINEQGKGNFEIIQLEPKEEEEDTTAFKMPFTLDVENVVIDIRQASFVSKPDKLNFTDIQLYTRLTADMNQSMDSIHADIRVFKLDWKDLHFGLIGSAKFDDFMRGRHGMIDLDITQLKLEVKGDEALTTLLGGEIPVPFRISDFTTAIHVNFDLEHPSRSFIDIDPFDIKAFSLAYADVRDKDKIALQLKAHLTELYLKDDFKRFDPLMDIDVLASANLQEVNPFIKDMLDSIAVTLPGLNYEIQKFWLATGESTKRAKAAMNNPKTYTNDAKVKGWVSCHVTTQGDRLSDWTKVDLNRMHGNIDIRLEDVQARLLKGYEASIPSLHLTAVAPTSKSTMVNYAYHLDIDDINVKMPDLGLEIPGIQVDYSGEYDSNKNNKDIENCVAAIAMEDIRVHIDTEYIWIKQPTAGFELHPQAKAKTREHWYYSFSTDSLRYTTKSGCEPLTCGALVITYDEHDTGRKADYFTQWQPVGQVRLERMHLQGVDADIEMDLPLLDLTLKDQVYSLNHSRFKLGQSDFELTGKLKQLSPWMDGKDKLIADLKFKSDYTDVDELLELLQKCSQAYLLYTGEEMNAKKKEEKKEEKKDDEPFSITLPTDIDLAMDASINRCRVFRQDASKLHAGVYLHEGKAILKDVAFKSDAANLHVSAVLDAPNTPGQLYPDSSELAINFEMRDINIPKVIDIIPQVDSMMPMLRTLDGKVNISLTYSEVFDKQGKTIPERNQAAMMLSGTGLKLIPGDLYHKVATILAFKEKNNGIIDSIYAEAKLSHDTILVYPFLLALDKARIAVSGNNFISPEGGLSGINYHASMYKPIVVGVDLVGPLSDVDIKVVLPKYNGKFQPVRYYDAKQQATNIENEIDDAIDLFLKAIK